MSYLVATVVVIWICGLLVIAGQYLNDLRLVLNNVRPGAEFTIEPQGQGWGRDAANFASFALFENLFVAGAAFTLGRVFRLDRMEMVRISRCDPACLTEAGRLHLGRAARHERSALPGWPAASCS